MDISRVTGVDSRFRLLEECGLKNRYLPYNGSGFKRLQRPAVKKVVSDISRAAGVDSRDHREDYHRMRPKSNTKGHPSDFFLKGVLCLFLLGFPDIYRKTNTNPNKKGNRIQKSNPRRSTEALIFDTAQHPNILIRYKNAHHMREDQCYYQPNPIFLHHIHSFFVVLSGHTYILKMMTQRTPQRPPMR